MIGFVVDVELFFVENLGVVDDGFVYVLDNCI